MVKVQDIQLDTQSRKATVNLFSDTRGEVSGLTKDQIIGFPQDYDIDAGSTVMTSSGELAFMKSDGQWNWGD